ncbi:MAG TPA: TolC family protein [Mucilaginibacter sp.]|nr:TolC family protein [Mucilaginibacter sp.]
MLMLLKQVNLLKKIGLYVLLILLSGGLTTASAQNTNSDTAKNNPSLALNDCINYALQHQPALQNSLLNVTITKTNNAINLSGWLPQVSASGNAIHYIQQSGSSPQVQSTSTGTGSGTAVTTRNGQYANTFVPQLTASQQIFNPALIYASKSAPLYVKQAQQATDSSKINVVVNVSKSFYNLLLTLEQINVLKEDTARLGKNVRDTYHQYKGGIVDETDYEEATITLNNSMAQLKQANENIVPQYAALKQVMGYPPSSQFNVSFDTTQMIKTMEIDTTMQLQYEKRIEFQELNTQKTLQHLITGYYHHSFLPSVSAFFNYNYGFGNTGLSNLFDKGYPTSLIGISFSMPIFTGLSRVNNVRKSQLEEEQLAYDEAGLKSQIYTEYSTALANYKGNLYNLRQLQKNVAMAKRVYFVVTLQYKQGVVAYLNVITAESNLITSEINYLNALFQLLSSKIDLEKSMGIITY